MPKVLVITSKKEGFRRAGIAHSATPTEYPIDKFSAADFAALKAEPMLVVYEKDVPDPEPPLELEGGNKTDTPEKPEKPKKNRL